MRFPHRWVFSLMVMTGTVARADIPSAPAPVIAPAPGASSRFVGVISASQTVDLAPLVEGRLEQVKVRLGDHVEAGQVVATLETRLWQLELSARQAQFQAAEAEHARAVLLLTHAAQKLKRDQQIRTIIADDEVRASEQKVELATVDVNLAKAKLAEARALVDVANENLEQARIRAPFAGIVSEQYLQLGLLVNRSTPILRLVREDVRLRFAIPEQQVASIRPGSEVWVYAKNSPSAPLKAVVDRISPELTLSSRHLRAEAKLEIPAGRRTDIPIGSVVEVALSEAPRRTATASP
ncbi:MAG: efflux RND transporter periplasmic adaptor subunit [Cystobacter sp.]